MVEEKKEIITKEDAKRVSNLTDEEQQRAQLRVKIDDRVDELVARYDSVRNRNRSRGRISLIDTTWELVDHEHVQITGTIQYSDGEEGDSETIYIPFDYLNKPKDQIDAWWEGYIEQRAIMEHHMTREKSIKDQKEHLTDLDNAIINLQSPQWIHDRIALLQSERATQQAKINAEEQQIAAERATFPSRYAVIPAPTPPWDFVLGQRQHQHPECCDILWTPPKKKDVDNEEVTL